MKRIKFLIFLFALSGLNAQYSIRSSINDVPEMIDPETRVENELILIDTDFFFQYSREAARELKCYR